MIKITTYPYAYLASCPSKEANSNSFAVKMYFMQTFVYMAAISSVIDAAVAPSYNLNNTFRANINNAQKKPKSCLKDPFFKATEENLKESGAWHQFERWLKELDLSDPYVVNGNVIQKYIQDFIGPSDEQFICNLSSDCTRMLGLMMDCDAVYTAVQDRHLARQAHFNMLSFAHYWQYLRLMWVSEQLHNMRMLEQDS